MFKTGDLVREIKGEIMVTDGLPFEYNESNLKSDLVGYCTYGDIYKYDDYTRIPLSSIELVQYAPNNFKINIKEKEGRIIYTEEQVWDLLWKRSLGNLNQKDIDNNPDIINRWKKELKEWWDENKTK